MENQTLLKMFLLLNMVIFHCHVSFVSIRVGIPFLRGPRVAKTLFQSGSWRLVVGPFSKRVMIIFSHNSTRVERLQYIIINSYHGPRTNLDRKVHIREAFLLGFEVSLSLYIYVSITVKEIDILLLIHVCYIYLHIYHTKTTIHVGKYIKYTVPYIGSYGYGNVTWKSTKKQPNKTTSHEKIWEDLKFLKPWSFCS